MTLRGFANSSSVPPLPSFSERDGASPHYAEAIAAARLMGPAGLIAAFRNTPFWNDRGPSNLAPNLADLEPQLFGFFTAFLNWAPRPEDEEEEEDNEPLTFHTASETGPSPAS